MSVLYAEPAVTPAQEETFEGRVQAALDRIEALVREGYWARNYQNKGCILGLINIASRHRP
jgi:hypothetical protein